jgi:hypothetical protein
MACGLQVEYFRKLSGTSAALTSTFLAHDVTHRRPHISGAVPRSRREGLWHEQRQLLDAFLLNTCSRMTAKSVCGMC